MMRITLLPVISEKTLKASVSSDVLTVNGEKFDFGPMPDNHTISADAVGCEWISINQPISKVDRVISLTMKLPCSWETPDEVRSPEEVAVLEVTRGEVPFPDTAPVVKESKKV
ncbi:hypothetical protein K0P33_12080 [Pseudomonas sp. ArH3a]|uniref:hypothetical protein n=1 Tax=Pseudomonas sp. ArH3a TaxID=2862945 RepID=UPI001F5AF274|nr:hypothetical protein [Pseudomonas sp. ArH3a]UNM22141.1 hypothetical protein K0P33_12080 [Pseudomonas sp. ArH3a]